MTTALYNYEWFVRSVYNLPTADNFGAIPIYDSYIPCLTIFRLLPFMGDLLYTQARGRWPFEIERTRERSTDEQYQPAAAGDMQASILVASSRESPTKIWGNTPLP